MSAGRELVRLDGVTCRYHTELVLDDIDLTIPGAALVGIVGPSGSSKTTLLRTIIGSVRPVREASPGGETCASATCRSSSP